jgi:hypothetical protein
MSKYAQLFIVGIWYIFISYYMISSKMDIIHITYIVNFSWIGIVAISYTKQLPIIIIIFFCLLWSIVVTTCYRLAMSNQPF